MAGRLPYNPNRSIPFLKGMAWILLLVMGGMHAYAQEEGPKVTPVDPDEGKPQQIWHYYDRHGNPLDTPVLVLEEDTVAAPSPRAVFPAYNGVSVGVNFADAILMAFGQKYADFDLWANVSLFNWFFPTVECGVGWAKDTPSKLNYTYRTRPSFYLKAGFDYNFLYKSKPEYKLFLGLRAGWSSFKYDITDVTITDGYWDQTVHPQLRGLRCTSFYGECLLGLQVKIVSHFSLGWTVRWHFPFHDSADAGTKPWFVPGYGGSGSFGFSASAIWTIPARGKRSESNQH